MNEKEVEYSSLPLPTANVYIFDLEKWILKIQFLHPGNACTVAFSGAQGWVP